MATVQDIKRRIRSIANTRKITKAMELVAAAKLRRAEARIEAMRPYADRMLELMVGTARASASVRGLPLLQRRDVQTVAIVPLTGDRGLAGGFNAQVLRQAFALERSARGEGKDVRWLVSGKKGRSTLRFRGRDVAQAWTGFSDRPAYADAEAIAHSLAELYAEGEAGYPKWCELTLHAHMGARPTLIPVARQMLQYAKKHKRVWFARRRDIAEWAMQHESK